MVVRFLHSAHDEDYMVKVEVELLEKFKPTQFGFSERFDKIIIYDMDLLKNRKFLDILRAHDIVML